MQITRAVRPKGAPQKYHVYVDPGDGLVHAQNNRTGVTDHTGSTSDVVLAALLADLGSTVATATLSDETHNLAADTTIPANVGIQAVQGTLLRPASGVALTINGSLNARPVQVFDLSTGGTVTLGPGSVRKVYPEWAGYVPGATSDPSGTNQAALNWAIANSVSSGAPVWLCGRGVTTNVHGTIAGQSGMRMKGHGGFVKIDTGLGAPTNLLDLTGLSDIKIDDANWDGACVTFTETDRSNSVINAPNITNARFRRVWARNGKYCNWNGYGTDVTLEDCRMENAGSHNVFVSTGGAGTNRFKVRGGLYQNAGRSALGNNIAIQATSNGVDSGNDIFIGGGVSLDFPTASATAGCNIYVVGNSGMLSTPVTGATNATPIALTVTAHGMSTGQTATIASVGGNTAANGTWIVTVVDANTLSLNGSAGNGAYTSGGTASRVNVINSLKGLVMSGFRSRRAGNGNANFGGASIQLATMCPGAIISDFIDSESRFDGVSTGSQGPCDDTTISNFTVYGCLAGGPSGTQGGNGLEINDRRCRIVNGASHDNAGHGVYLGPQMYLNWYLPGSSRHLLSGVRSYNNGYNGVTFVGAMDEMIDVSTWNNGQSGFCFQGNPMGLPMQGLKIRGGRSYGNARYGLETNPTWTRTITGATNASPIAITATAHGMYNGVTVVIAGVGGNTAANGTWTITYVDANHFTLNGSTGNGAYTSGGTSTSASRCHGIDVDGLDFLATDLGVSQPNTLGAWSGSPINATLPDRLRNCPGYNVGYQAVTGAVTASQANAGGVLAANAASGAFALTLPKASLWPPLDELLLQKADSSANAVTVTPNGSDTINGAATKALAAQYAWLRLKSTGTAWIGMSGIG